jgi:hypothetical protein
MRNIPYTTSTGIKIGSRWNESPKPMPIDDPDMIAIQGWLIQSPDWHRARNLDALVTKVCLSIGFVIFLAVVFAK